MGGKMKTIGILGGIGPQASMHFEARIHAIAREHIPPRYNEGYPPLISVFMRHAPVLVKDGRPSHPLTLDSRLLDTARKLGDWADLIVIPSNTPHMFLDEIREAAQCTVLSIVDGTVEELHRRAAQPIGLLGLGIPQIYLSRFKEEGFEIVTATDEQREHLDAAILHLMEGRETDRDREAARRAVEAVRGAGAVVTVLGCTEIPLLLGEFARAPDLVDPAEILARAVVEAAL